MAEWTSSAKMVFKKKKKK